MKYKYTHWHMRTYKCARCGQTKTAQYISPKDKCNRGVRHPFIDVVLKCAGKMVQVGGGR